MQRYYVDKHQDEITVSSKDELYHHQTKVLRCKVGDVICLCSNDECIEYEITLVNKDELVLKSKHEVLKSNELNVHTTAYVALLKNQNFELVIQKLVELGVNKIVPFESSRTIVKIKNDQKLSRFKKIAQEACEQSQRNSLVEIAPVCHISDIICESDVCFVAYEKNEEDMMEISKLSKTISFVVGPEGGFALKEIELLKAKGFKEVSLGNRILRAETANMYIMSLLSSQFN